MGNRGNATYVEKAAYLRKWTDTDWITWKCPRFQRIFQARVKKKKTMGKTHIRKDCPSIYALMTLFHSYLANKFVSSFPQKAFFLHFDLYWQPHSSVARLFSGNIIDNHSSINMDFIWLVMWSRFKRFWRKRIYRLKNYLSVIIIFYNKDHQPSIAQSSPCSCWDHLLPFYLRVILIWTDDTYFPFEFLFLISDLGTFDAPLFW